MLLFSNYSDWKHRPPLCHLDRSVAQWRDLCGDAPPWKCFSTEESWAFGPPKLMKNGSCSATTVDGGTALPFVISTEAQRSGEICGSAVPSWKCFSTEPNEGICGFPSPAGLISKSVLTHALCQP